MNNKVRIILLALVLNFGLTWSAIAQETENGWLPVRGGSSFGISGMVLLEHQENHLSFLVVHDNKGSKYQWRFAKVTLAGDNRPQYVPLSWSGGEELPVDLEALGTVPHNGETSYIASSSSGTVYRLQLDLERNRVVPLAVFELPPTRKKSNFEALDLQEIEGQLLVAWAHRGKGAEPAKIYWGPFDLQTNRIDRQGSATLRVPFPRGSQVRHISDLKIDPEGLVWIAAASDNGNDGPFDSAVYIAGKFLRQGDRIVWQPHTPLVPLLRLEGHKVEALEFVPGAKDGIFLGTDDENLGSSLWVGEN